MGGRRFAGASAALPFFAYPLPSVSAPPPACIFPLSPPPSSLFFLRRVMCFVGYPPRGSRPLKGRGSNPGRFHLSLFFSQFRFSVFLFRFPSEAKKKTSMAEKTSAAPKLKGGMGARRRGFFFRLGGSGCLSCFGRHLYFGLIPFFRLPGS